MKKRRKIKITEHKKKGYVVALEGEPNELLHMITSAIASILEGSISLKDLNRVLQMLQNEVKDKYLHEIREPIKSIKK